MSKNKDKITEFKSFFDLEKEIAYINEMNKKGWKLVYIKAGCFYTFVKTQPDEYITILHAEDKENISSVTAFAAQCGYENIPHTMDGIGELLYLTGKKSEISGEFVSDRDSSKKYYEILHKNMKMFCIIYYIMFIVFTPIFLLYSAFAVTVFADIPVFASFIIGFSAAFIILFLASTIKLTKLKNRYKKKVLSLSEELSIYE